MKNIYLSLSLIIGALSIMMVAPRAEADRGLEIALEAERRDAGWGDESVTLRMVLQDRRGQTRERDLRLLLLEKPGNEGDQTLTIFDAPADMQGTIFLSHAKVGEDDALWLYLPALKRVKRISSANKTGAFFGSEFAYEDIAAPEVGKFTYRYETAEPCGDSHCFVVARFPAYPNSGYSKLLTWYDQMTYRPLRIDYYDHDGVLLKRLSLQAYRLHKDKFWRPHRLVMDNHKTGKTTILNYSDYTFGKGLSDRDFNPSSLKSIR
jgi:outer membrane lipoprotein-sorting protein